MKICKRIGYVDMYTRGSTGTHVTSMWVGGDWLCTCPSFYYRKKCKHLSRLIRIMNGYNIEDILNDKAGNKYGSSIDGINEMLDDKTYNSNEIVAVYGKPKVGKSLLSIQEACHLTAEGYNVLFIDTEGSLVQLLKKWVPVFEEKYGERKGRLMVESKKDLINLMGYLGHKSELKKKGKGKIEFQVNGSIDSKLEDTITKKKIDFVILDSLTSPLRVFTKQTQNYPARGDATAFILTTLVRFQENYDVGCLITNHASWNPTNPYETMAEATGGVCVHYYAKRLIYLDKRKAKAYKNYRRFWLVRGETDPEWSKVTITKIDDNGYQDENDKKTKKDVLTNSEQRKVGLK